MEPDVTAAFDEASLEQNTKSTQVMSRTGEFTVQGDWDERVHQRLTAAMDRFHEPLTQLVEREANQGDTRLWVVDFLVYGLNFSKHGELTTQYRTSGASIDYAVMRHGRLFAPVEVKACSQGLDARNLQQARRLAVQEGAHWVLLTNGRRWQAYHLRPTSDDAPPRPVRVVDVDLLAWGGDTIDVIVEELLYLTQEGIAHGRLDRLAAWRQHCEPAGLADALRSEHVLEALRWELRHRTGHPGHSGETEELLRTLNAQVIARGL